MKKTISQEIKIPEGIEVKLDGSKLIIKGPEGEINRLFNLRKLDLKIEKDSIIIGCKNSTKEEKKQINTITSHIKNMIKGIQKKFEYRLKICASHFPMNVSLDGNTIIIKNFLGERIQRKSKIPNGAEVKISGSEIIILSTNKEIAGQAAANLENATRINNRDKRIFQDGIYITHKGGKEI
jgi:large subunit ribosomal protein L6